EAVWTLWTTRAGLVSFFPREAKMQLTVGGPFEMYFLTDAPEGARGSEGCRVLAFLPPEMLAFDWSAPPQYPTVRKERTQVVVQLEALGPDQTRVRLTQHGWGVGDEWDQVYEYFSKAWARVLTSLHQTLTSK
ncbi:MAG: SRPBCC domain-containing protein, partial [Planctomycetota bacterium]